jgi:hypothetical protein
LGFHGECIPNSDEYYSVSINTLNDFNHIPLALYAKSPTDYYFIWNFHTNVLGNTAYVQGAAKIHFDPDTS